LPETLKNQSDMAEEKQSFLLYADIIHTVRKMPKEKVGELFLTILAYVNDEDPVVDDIMVDLVFEPIKWQLKRDLKKWEAFREKQSNNGKLGGRPKKPTELHENPKNPSLLDETQKSLHDTVTVNVNETETTLAKLGLEDCNKKMLEDMVVLEMMKIWKKHNPDYFEQNTSDYSSCLQIAYKIAATKGWKNSEVLNGRMKDTLSSWERIVEFIIKDTFYCKLSLEMINNKWQGVLQTMNAAKKAAEKPKQTEVVIPRVTHDDLEKYRKKK
jgi:hypothetical protein